MSLYKSYSILILLIAVSFITEHLRPHLQITKIAQIPDYDSYVPKKVGTWNVREDNVPDIVDPGLLERLDKIYSVTVNKVYIDDVGESAVMLSLAYGLDQSDDFQIHKPEVCYPAQGFELIKVFQGSILFDKKTIPVTRMVVKNGSRMEFVTYWIKTGDQIYNSSLQRKLYKIKEGLIGKIPDGLLFRVSTIGGSESTEFEKQQIFINSFLRSLNKDLKPYFIGSKI